MSTHMYRHAWRAHSSMQAEASLRAEALVHGTGMGDVAHRVTMPAAAMPPAACLSNILVTFSTACAPKTAGLALDASQASSWKKIVVTRPAFPQRIFGKSPGVDV